MKSTNEKLLRSHIRSVINYKLNKKLSSIVEESKLRHAIRKVILEVDDPEEDPHEFTGINVLRELFKNSNILQQMRQAYKSLTTDEAQRKSFRAHIIRWTLDTLNPIEATEKATVSEGMDVDIDIITDEERNMMIDADDGSPDELNPAVDTTPEPEEGEEEMQQIPGTDKTGRNTATTIYPSIETSIVKAFNKLDNVKDIEIFRKWLIANEKLYFDKWENEMNPNVKEPESTEYDSSKQDTATETEGALDAPPGTTTASI